MRQGDPQSNDGAMEKWGNEIFNAPSLQHSNTPTMAARQVQRRSRSKFAFGVIALGRAVENCLNASTISAEENAVCQILSDRMALVQAASAVPDTDKEFKIKTSYGGVILTQKTAPAALTEPDNTLITGINLVTLTARWEHAGVPQSKQIQFYVYRSS